MQDVSNVLDMIGCATFGASSVVRYTSTGKGLDLVFGIAWVALFWVRLAVMFLK